MTTHIIKTIAGYNGELYGVISNRRILIAKCNPQIEIREQRQNIPAFGRSSAEKKIHITLVICNDTDVKCPETKEYFDSIEEYDISMLVQRADGAMLPITLNNLIPEYNEAWAFSVDVPQAMMNKLLNL